MQEFPFVSIIVPTLGREEKLKRCLEAIRINACYPEDRYEIIIQQDNYENRKGVTKNFKEGVEKAKGDLVMFLANDVVVKKDFLLEAVKRMKEVFPDLDGMVGLNDELYNGDLVGHWLGSKKLLPLLGNEFFHTGYHHVCCDSELIERCKKLGKYTWAEKARIFHDHPENGGRCDPVYSIGYEKGPVAEDMALWVKRSKELGYPMRECSKRTGYPREIDLELRIRDLDWNVNLEDLKVLNVGMGNGNGGLAKQLPNIEFGQLDHLDIEPAYFEKAKLLDWKTKNVNYILGDIRDCINFDYYDIILLLDIVEHLPKEDGIKLVESVKNAIIFIPLEKEFRPNASEFKSEDHLALWTEDDLKSRGYKTEILPNFHGDFSAMWAIKSKK